MNKNLLCFFLSLFVAMAMLPVKSSYAISDKQYAECKKLSKEFTQTEKDLNTLWKELNSLIKNKDKKQQLLDNQRAWLKERDKEHINEDGVVDIPKFTWFTQKRVAELIIYKEYVKNDYLPIKITGNVIEEGESRYSEETAYKLYTELHVNKSKYNIWIHLCSSEEKENHKDVDKILKRAEDNKDKCSVLVDYDLLGEPRVISFVNPSKSENCSLNWQTYVNGLLESPTAP